MLISFLDKLNFLREQSQVFFEEKDIYQLDIPNSGLTQDDIEKLKEIYSYIDGDYIDFLKNYNGMELDDFRFLGGSLCQYGGIIETGQWLEEDCFEGIPIALDSAGDIFFMDKNKKIYWVMIDNLSEKNNSKFIANNFSDFINNICLGSNYKNIYGNTPWGDFLKSQGWA